MKTNAHPSDFGHHGPLYISFLRRPLVAAVCVILILLATARSTHGQTPPAGDYGDALDDGLPTLPSVLVLSALLRYRAMEA